LAIAREENGSVWFSTPQGVTSYRNGAFASDKLSERNVVDRVYSMCACSQGGVWIATADGLKRFQNGVVTRFSNSDGLRTNLVVSVLEDADGMLWIGTSEGLQRRDPVAGRGELLCFRNGRFAPFGHNEGLPGEVVLCAHEDREGNLWIGTVFGGLKRVQPRRILAYSTPEGLAHNNVWSICQSRGGGLWV